MQEKMLTRLPLGAIMPKGWLRDQLQIQAEGLTGNLADFWPDVGADCDWLGGEFRGWERPPYYLDGLYPLSVLLDDPKLKAKAQPYIEYMLSSQREDGWFGPETCYGDYWALTIALKVLIQYQEYTGDARVIPLMEKFFDYAKKNLPNEPLKDWAISRAADTAYCMIWLYEHNGDEELLPLAEEFLRQGIDWSNQFNEFPWTRPVSFYLGTPRDPDFSGRLQHYHHVVNVAMGIKYPAIKWLLGDKPYDQVGAFNGIDNLMRYHGQAGYIFSGDEHLSGDMPTRGSELCSVVEYLFSLQSLLEIFGEAQYADLLERVAYNALPGTISKDWWQHQYNQQANQIACTDIPDHWHDNTDDSNTFGLEPNYGCCTANMHQGWPKFIANLWMQEGNDSLVAAVFGPSEVTATLGGKDVTILEETEYPFRDTIIFTVKTSSPAAFNLKLRVPDWCEEPQLFINGEELNFVDEDGFTVIARTWNDSDKVELRLPRQVNLSLWHNDSAAVEYGPLTFSLRMEEQWNKRGGTDPYADYDIIAKSPWNYALAFDAQSPEDSFEVTERAYGRQPFDRDCPPLVIRAKAMRYDDWKEQENHVAADVPQCPIALDGEIVDIELAPYGAGKLRITAFPWVDLGE